MRQVKIGPAGIRGLVGEGLDLDQVIDLVSAMATWLDGAPVLVARDTRPSSPMIASATVAALSAAGCEVLDAGICPTAVAQAEAQRCGAGGAISVTASHNDARWNGLKLFGEGGRVLGSSEGREILDLWHQGEFNKASYDRLGAIRVLDDVIDRYIDELVAAVDRERIAAASLRVVVDAANGAGAMVAPALCRALGVELIPISCEPSGDFTRPPDPTRRNLAQAAAVVHPVAAAAGFGFSSDCERLAMITDSGEALGTQATLPLIVNSLPEQSGPVVAAVACDSRTERIARQRGLSVVRSGIGAQAVIERMLSDDACIGGEGSGGVALRGFRLAFDGLYAMAQLLEQLASTSARELAAALPIAHYRTAEVPCRASRGYSVVGAMTKEADGAVTLLDGLRVDRPDGSWYHVRVSHTESVIRVCCEARDAASADDLVEELMRRVRAAAVR